MITATFDSPPVERKVRLEMTETEALRLMALTGALTTREVELVLEGSDHVAESGEVHDAMGGIYTALDDLFDGEF
jgi:hypothetical protein